MPEVACRYCDVQLYSEKQFFGHYIIGHELTLESARLMWSSETVLWKKEERV